VRALTILLLAVLAATALGCQESGFDERKETARPLKVQHVLGETKVPGQAERPLTLTLDALDDTLALGIRPVLAAVPGGQLPSYLRGQGGDVALMAPFSGRSDLPAVEAADPDLILGSDSRDGRFYERLSAIAPTVMTEGRSGQWKLGMRLVGEALGQTNDAEALLTQYDEWVARARRAIGGGRPRVAVARMTRDGLRFAKRDSFAGTVLADVGLRQVRSQGESDVLLDDAVWWGPGGILQARAALRDLQRALRERRRAHR
jgi:iron complex transport system substrate-binding protein